MQPNHPFRSDYEDCIASVDIRAEYIDDTTNRQKVVYSFTPHRFRFVNKVEIKGAGLMTPEDIKTITADILPKDNTHLIDVAVVDKLRGRVEQW